MINIILRIALAAFIGYCTNYIAIKMLFNPKKAIKIFGFRVPFTPGIIPKNRSRIAKAVGNAVNSELLTNEDLVNSLCSNEVKEQICNSILSKVYMNNLSIQANAEKIIGIEKLNNTKQKIEDIIYEKIKQKIDSVDIGEIIQREILPPFKERIKQNMMLSMFINDSVIQSFINPIEQAIKNYINENVEQILRNTIKEEINKVTQKRYSDILDDLSLEQSVLQNIIYKVFDKVVKEKTTIIIQKINIASLVEQKINDMDVQEIEDLVMSVMQNELRAIVNLGALIGAVIGVLNLFI